MEYVAKINLLNGVTYCECFDESYQARNYLKDMAIFNNGFNSAFIVEKYPSGRIKSTQDFTNNLKRRLLK